MLYFTGEAIFPFMLEEAGLGCFAAAAEALAEQTHWPTLYDRERLLENKVPVKVVPYWSDVYVDYDFSHETVGMISECEPVKVPDDWLHTSLKKDKTKEICEKLFDPMPREK